MRKDWEKIAEDYSNKEEIIQLYQEWGNTPYLSEIFQELSRYEPEWNKEKELGSWAPEFILDILEEAETELDEMDNTARCCYFREKVEERYDDFCSGHQFARINNVALQKENEDIRNKAEEEGEKIGFPVL